MIYSEDTYPSLTHKGFYRIVIIWSGPLDYTWVQYVEGDESWPITAVNTNVYLQDKEQVGKEVVKLGDEFVSKLKIKETNDKHTG
jgi:hypothetical protein